MKDLFLNGCAPSRITCHIHIFNPVQEINLPAKADIPDIISMADGNFKTLAAPKGIYGNLLFLKGHNPVIYSEE
jgi:hypothetical protein